jgi:hypothetical protein
MKGKEVFEVILGLFLISVGALELILWQDRKKQQDSTPREPESAWHAPLPAEAASHAPLATNDLLSLMRAVNGELAGDESPLYPPSIEGVPEFKRAADNAGLVEATGRHNQV